MIPGAMCIQKAVEKSAVLSGLFICFHWLDQPFGKNWPADVTPWHVGANWYPEKAGVQVTQSPNSSPVLLRLFKVLASAAHILRLFKALEGHAYLRKYHRKFRKSSSAHLSMRCPLLSHRICFCPQLCYRRVLWYHGPPQTPGASFFSDVKT